MDMEYIILGVEGYGASFRCCVALDDADDLRDTLGAWCLEQREAGRRFRLFEHTFVNVGGWAVCMKGPDYDALKRVEALTVEIVPLLQQVAGVRRESFLMPCDGLN